MLDTPTFGKSLDLFFQRSLLPQDVIEFLKIIILCNPKTLKAPKSLKAVKSCNSRGTTLQREDEVEE